MSGPNSQHVTVTTDGGPMPAYLWVPETGGGPGLVLLQEIFGVSGYIQRRGADLAEAGYVVLAPELYWRLGEGALDESTPGVIEEAVSRMQRLDWPTTVQDTLAALLHLRDLVEVNGAVGVIGFCFGGGLAFNVAAVDEPDVMVSYYGTALPSLLHLAPQVTAPSQYHFGTADQYIEPALVEQVRAAVTEGAALVDFETYAGANHAFDNPDFFLHHAEASALAWERTLAFLSRELPTG